MTVDLRLARKVYERGLPLSGPELGWEAYHLAKDVLEQAGQLPAGPQPDVGHWDEERQAWVKP